MENIDGALFCEECGAKMEEAGHAEGVAAEEKLVLKSTDGRSYDISEKDDVVIGREDPVSEVFPDIDLSDLSAMDSGVSRRHAVIHRAGPDYTIEDLDSTNGTYINRKKIKPHEPKPIKAGDEIRFGKLPLTVQAA
jgi:pSer/pThr/pTyr-binding forkhead associated (FHA) protein